MPKEEALRSEIKNKLLQYMHEQQAVEIMDKVSELCSYMYELGSKDQEEELLDNLDRELYS